MPERCAFVPTYLLQRIADRGRPHVAERARLAVTLDQHLRARRSSPARHSAVPPSHEPAPRRAVSDAGGSTTLPGRAVRTEGEQPSGDLAVDEAYEGLGATWALLHSEFGRDSLDGAGMPLHGVVHYGHEYANAFWDGEHMVFGDGDGEYFKRFTASLDVIGHELAHGLTDSTARLAYQGQSGALSESISDVVGSMVAQRVAGRDARQADWLIGANLFTEQVNGVALRSMLHPGTAYDDPVLGTDPQPHSMAGFVRTSDDNGGVHINSGIPNRAFALAATAIGGPTWEGAGAVWMAVLLGGAVPPDCDFATFARLCLAEADRRWGAGSARAEAVHDGWRAVGVLEGAGMHDHDEAQGVELHPEGDHKPPQPAPRMVVICRSGGVTGMSTERRMNLGSLPHDEASQWRELLTSGVLQTLAPARPRPDGFVYRVRCPGSKIDVTAAETELPDGVRTMIDQALRRDV